MTGQPSVAVLGLGQMGAPIASNLIRAGFEVTVWNRTSSVARPFAVDGASVADSPAGVEADVVLSVLPTRMRKKASMPKPPQLKTFRTLVVVRRPEVRR